MKETLVLRRIKWILLAILPVVFIAGLAFNPVVDARAGLDSGPQLNHPLFQATDYPGETPLPTYDPYPGQTQVPTSDPYPAGTPSLTITNTPSPGSTGVQPSVTPGGPTVTMIITNTPTVTTTPPPNTFKTEDSEMGGSQATPPASETPGPTASVSATQLLTPAASMTRTARLESADKQNRLRINWGMFWMGFALPVVAACGVVLYLLDRRPDLFRPKQK